MVKVRLGVYGASGKMGAKVVQLSQEDQDIELVYSYSRKLDSDLTKLCNLSDVVIDFSTSQGTIDLVNHLLKTNSFLRLVICTTGFDKNNFKGDTKLEAVDISFTNEQNIKTLQNVSLEIKSGEVLGVAGVSGNGQVELANIICGIIKDFEGRVIVKTKDVTGKGVKSRKKLNLSYIPENRLGVGLAPGVSVLDNSAIKEYFQASFGPHLSKNVLLNSLNDLINKFSIKAPDVKAEISTLSGGNMQKLLMGRELISNPDVIIAAQPTRGLDVSAVDSIHNLIIDQRDKGSAILLISEDLDELFKLSDRLIVMYEGKVITEIETELATVENIGLAMAGINE